MSALLPRSTPACRITMGLFDKKKKEKIPEVGQPAYGGGTGYGQPGPSSSPSLGRNNSYASSAPSAVSSVPPSYRTAPGYVPPSQGGSGYQNQSHFNRPPPPLSQYQYQQQQQQPPPSDRPPVEAAAGKSKGSWFGRGNKKAEADARNELLAGAPPPGQGPSRFGAAPGSGAAYDPYGGPGSASGGNDGHGQQQQAQEFETEEDQEVEGIKQQMRFTKQESLASTRNAVRIAREAEETARATLDKLGEQSGPCHCPPPPWALFVSQTLADHRLRHCFRPHCQH